MKPFLICKRIFCCFLITVILTVSCFVVFNKPVKTSANPIAIGAAVIAGLGAFMASAGLTITNNGIQDGQGLQTMWENILHDFSYDNKALQDWYEGGNEVVNFIIGKENNAKIALLGKEFAIWLNEAKKWLVEKFGIGQTPVPIEHQGSFIFDIHGNALPVLNYESGGFYAGNFEQGLFSIPLTVGESHTFTFANDTILIITLVSKNTIFCQTYIDGVFQREGNVNPNRIDSSNVFVRRNGTDYDLYWFYQYGGDNSMYQSSFIDDISAVFEDALPTISSIGCEGSLTDGYDDFEQALEDSMTQTGTGEGAVIGVNVGGVDIDQPYTQERLVDGTIDSMLSNTLTGELVGGYENEKEAENENDASVAPVEGEIADNIIKIDGIEDFFPFCIPFDLYHLIEKFNVSPVTPKFKGNLNFAGVFSNFEFDIDLTPFDTIASLFRIIFIIGFVIFLIIKTRDLIRG